MKYLIRSIKYFFYFSAITAVIIFMLVFIGAVEGDISQIFDGGYSAIWKIAIFCIGCRRVSESRVHNARNRNIRRMG